MKAETSTAPNESAHAITTASCDSAAIVRLTVTQPDDTSFTIRALNCPCMMSERPPAAERRMVSQARTFT